MVDMTHNRNSLTPVLLAAGLVSASLIVPAHAADPIRLNPGYVSLVKLDQTISTIIIGNPDVVDATLQGKNAILLTAKKITGSAATNVIVLNPQDSEIFSATIIVGTQGGAKTEIHTKGGRGGSLHEYWAYRCMPTCERVKDELETFQRGAAPAPVAASVVVPASPSPSGSEAASSLVPQY
jgi:Pilus formation protein N terminal region